MICIKKCKKSLDYLFSLINETRSKLHENSIKRDNHFSIWFIIDFVGIEGWRAEEKKTWIFCLIDVDLSNGGRREVGSSGRGRKLCLGFQENEKWGWEDSFVWLMSISAMVVGERLAAATEGENCV